MSRLVLGVVVLTLLLAAPGSAQILPQETHTGRVEPGSIQIYAFTPLQSGQLIATLSWDSSLAQLVLILVCTVEGEEIPYGVASGLLDRFARLEAGILATYPCEIGVSTATSSADYRLNLQRSTAEPSTEQVPETIPTTRALVTTAIPGTRRGAAIEAIASRLQRAMTR